jgi:hypothetical protein
MPEPGMELRSFISETLLAVMNGVLAAQQEVQQAGHTGVICQVERTATHSQPQDIEFDIAITVDAKSETGGGFKLTVAVVQIGLGANTSVGDRESRTSRVRFRVPVTLPSVNTSPEKDRHLPEHKPRRDIA